MQIEPQKLRAARRLLEYALAPCPEHWSQRQRQAFIDATAAATDIPAIALLTPKPGDRVRARGLTGELLCSSGDICTIWTPYHQVQCPLDEVVLAPRLIPVEEV